MGGSLSKPLSSTTAPSPRADSFLGELGGEVQYEKSMGVSRFLKTIRARHKEGALVVKVYLKPDASLSLKSIHRRLKAEREALTDCSNVLAYQRIFETERAGYLIRQWLGSNLYDRISTRPFLTSIEKRWITFQLLTALSGCHSRGVAHGDIKTENILITSSLTLYLTDFSSFKPVYLPLNDPSPYSLYFDTSARRTCYLAPERFYEPNSDIAQKKEKIEWGRRDGRVTESMDIFSAGCTIAELWMEGTPIFTLSQLFAYRKGEYSPEPYLEEIDDPDIRNLIRSMISLVPTTRQTFSSYLSINKSLAFPSSFYDFLQPFTTSLSSTSSTTTNRATTPNASTGTVTGLNELNTGAIQLTSEADDIVEKIWGDWELIRSYLEEESQVAREKEGGEAGEEAVEGAEEKKNQTMHALFPIQLHLPGMEADPVTWGPGNDGISLIFLSLLTSALRNCQRPSSILRAFDILLALSQYLTDENLLDRLLPFLVAMGKDKDAGVRSGAVRSLTQIVLLVQTITPSNSLIFPSYVLPNTRSLSTDPEILVRVTYAQCIAPLAITALRYLELTEALKPAGGEFRLGGAEFDTQQEATYDMSLQELQAQIQEHLHPLLTDTSSSVKRALLTQITSLCTFFGPILANDAILAHLITYLNTRDWRLRADWNERAVEVASCVGRKSLEEYILPLVVLSLADAEEAVVATVLASLTRLAELHLLGKGQIWDLVQQITGFLCHPNIWIREGAAAFLSSTATLMPPTDRWCILYPTVKRLLRADIKEITALSILDNAREPISRVIFEAAIAWARQAGKSHFWSPPTKTLVKGAARDASIRTDEDSAQLEKMRQLGMKPEDEYKLGAMRDHIAKVASARQSSASRIVDPSDELFQPSGAILQDLGIVPETIFFSIRPANQPNESLSRTFSDSYPRRFSNDPPRSVTSLDLSRGARVSQPVDDLRRKLALANVSNASLPLSSGGLPLTNEPSLTRGSSNNSTDDLSDTIPTPTHTDIIQRSTRSRIHGDGVEVGRAAPAIGQDSTNVMGMFNVEAIYRGEEDVMSAITNVVSHSAVGLGTPPQRFTSTYEGNDPSIKQLLERVYLDSYREPLLELGPRVPLGIPRRKALRTSFPPRERTPRRPDGTLVAHLVEHTGAITDIQVSPDQLFFVTGSEDGTVKVWDTIRLEKNVTSRSRQTFQQGGRITAVCILENSHCVVSASDNGTVWIHRVDVSLAGSMPKYSKNHLIRQYTPDGEGEYVTCLASYNTDTTTNLILGTSSSIITILDIRTMRTLSTFNNPTPFGPITALCIDRKRVWMVVGTAGGTLCLWDLRFGLLLRSWTVGSRRVLKVEVNPFKGKGRWITVIVESGDEVEEAAGGRKLGALVAEVWDIDRGSKVEEFRVVGSSSDISSTSASSFKNTATESLSTSMKEATLDPAKAIEALLLAHSQDAKMKIRATIPVDKTTTITSNQPGVRAFLSGIDYSVSLGEQQRSTGAATGHLSVELSGEKYSGSSSGKGYLITAGEDRKIRFWDVGKVDDSKVFSGADPEEDLPVYDVRLSTLEPTRYLELPSGPSPSSRSRLSSTASSPRQKPHRSTLIANSQQELLRGHQDCITALGRLDLPFRCVVSGDRSGVVKVFE